MKKRILLTAAAFALLTTTALADDQAATAEWVSTLIFYDKQCEPLGPGFEGAAIEALGPIPRGVHEAALDRVEFIYKSLGPERFCEITQGRIATNRRWLFQAR